MEETEVKRDKFGRILNKFNGAPLRDHRRRNHGPAPFRGEGGKPNPGQRKLDARIKAFEDSAGDSRGYRRPGSLKK